MQTIKCVVVGDDAVGKACTPERESHCHSTLPYRSPLASQLAPVRPHMSPIGCACGVEGGGRAPQADASKRFRCADDATLLVFIDVFVDILHHKQVPKRICPHGKSHVIPSFSTALLPCFAI